MARNINTIESANKWAQQQPDRIVRVWTFRTQEQMDLWINEMQGQISDGMWENCRNTNWLWEKQEVYQLGDRTELHIKHYWMKGKVGYPLTKELLDCIGDRMLEENGFETVKELKSAWREILAAIADPRSFTDSDKKLVEKFVADKNKEEVKAKNRATKELQQLESTLEEMYEKVQSPVSTSTTSWKKYCTSESRKETVNISYNYMEGIYRVDYRIGTLPELEMRVRGGREKLVEVLNELREHLGRVSELKSSIL